MSTKFSTRMLNLVLECSENACACARFLNRESLDSSGWIPAVTGDAYCVLSVNKFGENNYCGKPIFTADLSVCVGFMLSLRGESGR